MKNFELNRQQREIIQTEEPRVIVASSAGSGKTRCLIERFKWLLRKGVDPSKIVLITFTNAAADEIKDRVKAPITAFVGTVHSYANKLLKRGGENTEEDINSENFDNLLTRIKEFPDYVLPVEHLLLDEGQDSSDLQLEFLLDIIQPENWMIFSDWRQSIYRFAGAVPDRILELRRMKNITEYYLDTNYRNGEKILDYAKKIIKKAGIDYIDNSRSASEIGGRVEQFEFNPEALSKTLKQLYDFDESKDWFVLTRTNAQLAEMAKSFEKLNIPYETFKRADLDYKTFNDKMKNDKIKLLTIHSAKGLEADNVVVIGANTRNLEEICIAYVAATRAKKHLFWGTTPRKNKRKRQFNWEER